MIMTDLTPITSALLIARTSAENLIRISESQDEEFRQLLRELATNLWLFALALTAKDGTFQITFGQEFHAVDAAPRGQVPSSRMTE